MHTLLLQFVLTLAMYILLDVVWFMCVLQPYFFDSLGHHLNIRHDHVELRWLPAVLVYAFLSLGMVTFVLPSSELLYGLPVVFRASLYGFVVYGFYEMTCGALLHKWPVPLMVADIAWGVVSSAITALVVTTMIPGSLTLF